MFCRSWWPIESARRLAPITATVSGKRTARMLSDSARCSRAMNTACDCSVGVMVNDTAMTPSS